MRLPICAGYFISDITSGDKASYVEHLREKEISDRTLRIPYPYAASDADFWISHVEDETRKQGRSVNWAIRRPDGQLIGGIGFGDLTIGKSYKSELGYWLAKPFWNQGIMTEAVKKSVGLGFNEFGLIRISAHVFHFNLGSTRVLEKAGFQLEGTLRSCYRKNGNIFDGKLYAIVKEVRS